MNFKWLLIGLLAVSPLVMADKNKLSNDKLNEKSFSRLEGSNAFKVGCRHIVRSEDRAAVFHPTTLSNQEIGFSLSGSWHKVQASDKTKLMGKQSQKVTVWRDCGAL